MIRLSWLKKIWCEHMHTQAMWPMHGKYICSRCLCEHTVAWETATPSRPYVCEPVRQIDESPLYAARHASAGRAG